MIAVLNPPETLKHTSLLKCNPKEGMMNRISQQNGTTNQQPHIWKRTTTRYAPSGEHVHINIIWFWHGLTEHWGSLDSLIFSGYHGHQAARPRSKGPSMVRWATWNHLDGKMVELNGAMCRAHLNTGKLGKWYIYIYRQRERESCRYKYKQI